MKKVLSLLLTVALTTGTSTVVFAEGNDTTAATDTAAQTTGLTPEQQQARDEFITTHFEDMNQLVTLRNQTKDAIDTNNATAKQIKEKVKDKITLNKDTAAKIKDLANQRRALLEQAKQIHAQRLTLRTQYKDAVKARNVDQMKSIEQQILDLNNKVKDLKAQDDAIKAQVQPLKEQLKAAKDSNQQLRENVKNQLQQAKSLGDTIKALEQDKAQLWNTYKQDIKNKDYTAAGTAFKQIIDKKTAILDNIKQRGTILNQVLASLN